MSAGEKRALLRLISSSCSAFSRSNEFEGYDEGGAPGWKPGSSVLAPPSAPWKEILRALKKARRRRCWYWFCCAAKLGIPRYSS